MYTTTLYIFIYYYSDANNILFQFKVGTSVKFLTKYLIIQADYYNHSQVVMNYKEYVFLFNERNKHTINNIKTVKYK
jgi:hypothetical protein